MSFSPRPPSSGTPRRNSVIESASLSLAWASHELSLAARALAGREFIVDADIEVLTRHLASATATLAKVSAELASPETGLLVRGARPDHDSISGGLRS